MEAIQILWFPAPGILRFERILDKIQRIWDENRRKKEQAHCGKNLLSLLLFYYYLYLPVIQSVQGKELFGIPWDLERYRNGVS